MSWDMIDKKLRRELRFRDFATALAFVNEVGAVAEEVNHHPDVFLTWGRVVIELTTHDAGGVTDKDHDLAAKIEVIAHRYE